MLSSKAQSVPLYHAPVEVRILPARISAIPVLGADDGGKQLGAITQLPRGAELQISGEGFNDGTVEVRCQDCFYFVFRDDLEIVTGRN